MRIASWNVNSMKARIEHVLAFLGTDKCDVLLAQELKLTDENFPTDSFTKNGWHVETHGQKTYNGVAIISRYPISDVLRGLPLLVEEDAEDDHARYIEARIDTPDLGMIRVGCIYLPNGNPAPAPNLSINCAGLTGFTHMLPACWNQKRKLPCVVIITSCHRLLTVMIRKAGQVMPYGMKIAVLPFSACAILAIQMPYGLCIPLVSNIATGIIKKVRGNEITASG